MTALELHHLGLACHSIERDLALLRFFGAQMDGPEFTDLNQGIRGQFVLLGSVRLEVLEEYERPGTLAPWLKAGSRLYHVGFTCHYMDQTIDGYLGGGAKLVRPPMPAVAFGGREVAFVMLPNMLLLELIQCSHDDA